MLTMCQHTYIYKNYVFNAEHTNKIELRTPYSL